MGSVIKVSTLVVMLTFVVFGCGKKDEGGGGGGGSPAVGQCPAGQVMTQYGCLSTSGCSNSYGNYNGQCVPPSTGTGQQCQAGYLYHTSYGCLPQGNCQSGYVTYNNQCIPLSGGSGSGCPAGYQGYPPNCYPINNTGGNVGGSTGGGWNPCQMYGPNYYPYPHPYYGIICLPY